MRARRAAAAALARPVLQCVTHTSPHAVVDSPRFSSSSAAQIFIVMEYCEGGDLGALVRRCKRDGSRVSEDFVWQVRTY